MDAALERYLEELFQFGRAHDSEEQDRRERFRNVEPETARMLAVLVRGTGARRVLEVGTSNGYSTLWLADAVASTGGTLTTIEIDEGRATIAKENFIRAGVADIIEVRVEDAAKTLSQSHNDAWDFVFLDAERAQYVGYWRDLLRILSCPGLLAVDNVLSHADELTDFRALVEGESRIASAVVPIGAGVLLAARDLEE